jgi:bidirectional [NiFe] hydrogenase diaphorase subunit
MTSSHDWHVWRSHQCRRNKICDWRCLSGEDTHLSSLCAGCERHRMHRITPMASGTPITLFVDGKPVQCDKGTLLIELLRANGFDVPTLCYHPLLSPGGACRLCLVEVRDRDGIHEVPACSTRVVAPIDVITTTPALVSHRKTVIEQAVDAAPGSEQVRALAKKWGVPLPAGTNNHCIGCGRCIQVCNEVIGAGLLVETGQTKNTFVTKKAGGNDICDECGACMAICPTGAVPSPPESPLAHVACGLCELICPEMAISTSADLKHHLDPTLCKRCGLCAHICPEDAISILPTDKN